VKYAFIDVEKAHYPVRLLCRCLEVSRSGYYGWSGRGPSSRTLEDERLGVEVAAIFKEKRRRYGSPRVRDELRDRGTPVARKRVARLMRSRGLRARSGRRRAPRTTDSRHGFAIAENRLGRNFRTQAPNRAWVGDVTYLPTAEGWLYLAVLLDLYSRRIVGYALSEKNDQRLAQAALQQALVLRQPERGLVHHTDRGSPYASDGYRATLDGHGIVASMSRRGDCYDNAVAESFFSTLEFELDVETETLSRAQVIRAVCEYIDGFYNCERRHSTIGGANPIAFEQRYVANCTNGRHGGSAPVPPLRKRIQESPEIAV
jgi:transposase InsO family protein